MLYSASTNGFYSEEINGTGIPEDAVEIPDELYFSLLGGQSEGLSIQPGADGYPILTEQPPPSAEQVLASALALRDNQVTMATLRINPLQDAVDLDDATAAEIALLRKWKTYRKELGRVDVSADPVVWPERPK